MEKQARHRKPPKMGNNGGTAFVRINGKRIYLGKFVSVEANQNYARSVAEWSAVAVCRPQNITIDTLAVAFLDYVKQHCGYADYCNYRLAVRIMLELYHGTLAEHFTPKCLIAVQERFVRQKTKRNKPYSRQYCNRLTNFIRTMFRWGVHRKLCSASVADALRYVPILRKGRTTAPETVPRCDVSDEAVNAVLPCLPPVIAAMAQIQRATAMRSGEVCKMRFCDIEMHDDVWLYRPETHKTSWRGHQRVIVLGLDEINIIKRLCPDFLQNSAVFSPIIARNTQAQCKSGKRKTTKSKQRKLKNREFYSTASYCRWIKTAIKKANQMLPVEKQIPHWTPYQLRHSAITQIAAKYGLDVARAVAGQKTISVTQRYNHSDVQVAVETARKRQSNQMKIDDNT
jgi:integrase